MLEKNSYGAKMIKIDFILDELNGISMEMSYLHDCFYSLFELGGSIYSTTFRRMEDGSLLWDLFVTPQQNPKVDVVESGEGDKKQTFKVSSFKPNVHQTVRFNKVN